MMINTIRLECSILREERKHQENFLLNRCLVNITWLYHNGLIRIQCRSYLCISSRPGHRFLTTWSIPAYRLISYTKRGSLPWSAINYIVVNEQNNCPVSSTKSWMFKRWTCWISNSFTKQTSADDIIVAVHVCNHFVCIRQLTLLLINYVTLDTVLAFLPCL